ncbi:MAG: alpha/beta fold hydrolase [Pirellulaceae bacterium]|jgi:proline iminopeptidase|nr:alpha/beta fold hydrolase [Pirellulaceae bacterium]
MIRKFKRPLIGCFAVFAVLALVSALTIIWIMGQPLYRFGAVSAGDNLRGPLDPPPQPDATSWQVERDIRLHFDAYGDGHPVLVVHGGPGIPYAGPWTGLNDLTDEHKFYYYHQRGCGQSSRPFDRFESENFYENMTELERTLGLGAQIADIERIRRILGEDQLTLVGHSYGGFIAALYAAEFPDRVAKLLLVAPAGVLTAPDDDRNIFSQARKSIPAEKLAEYDALVEEYFDFGNIFSKSDADLVSLHERIGRQLLPAMGYDADSIGSGPRSGGWSVFAMYFSSGKAPDYTAAVAAITAPTLIVHGVDDTISLAGSRTYERGIPGAKFVSLPRGEEAPWAGHFVFDDNPTAFSKAVESFLAE